VCEGRSLHQVAIVGWNRCHGPTDDPTGNTLPGVSHASDDHTKLMLARALPWDMHSDTANTVPVEVEFSADLLADIDAYATTHGYTDPDAVVREAIDRL